MIKFEPSSADNTRGIFLLSACPTSDPSDLES